MWPTGSWASSIERMIRGGHRCSRGSRAPIGDERGCTDTHAVALCASQMRGARVQVWCGRRDLNPHAFRHRYLKPACIPISPLPRPVDPTGGVVPGWTAWKLSRPPIAPVLFCCAGVVADVLAMELAVAWVSSCRRVARVVWLSAGSSQLARRPDEAVQLARRPDEARQLARRPDEAIPAQEADVSGRPVDNRRHRPAAARQDDAHAVRSRPHH